MYNPELIAQIELATCYWMDNGKYYILYDGVIFATTTKHTVAIDYLYLAVRTHK